MSAVLPLDAATYRPSALHSDDRAWQETNCYADLWIELLHAMGVDPVPALAFTLSVDFDDEQWQFFKFPAEDLRALYGIDVAEINPWRGVEHHAAEHAGRGRMLIVEVDAYHLPDTAGTSYRSAHVKSSIAVNSIDPAGRRLGYFHGAGYYALDGEDYEGVFRHHVVDPDVLAPYVELVKLDGLRRPEPDELLAGCVDLVRSHVARRPASNPVRRFRKRFEQDLAWLRAEDLTTFHLYAFATLRQCGAGAELASTVCAWLADQGQPTAGPAESLAAVSSLAKSLQFKMARIATGRQVAVDDLFDEMEDRWDAAMAGLAGAYDG